MDPFRALAPPAVRGIASVLLAALFRVATVAAQSDTTPGTHADSSRLTNARPVQVSVEPFRYREGRFERAWSLNVVHDRANRDVRPGLVILHGGGFSKGDKDEYVKLAADFVKQGYVCITPSYRYLGEAQFPACIEDVKCAVRWFRANAARYWVDPDRIGAFGSSAGAHLACMLGLAGSNAGLEGDGPHRKVSSAVQAVVANAPPADLFDRPPPGWKLAKDPELATTIGRLSSPVTYARADAPPMLIFHGTADTVVPVSQSDTLVAALKAAGAKDLTYLRVEGAGHRVIGDNYARFFPVISDFFDRTLKRPPSR